MRNGIGRSPRHINFISDESDSKIPALANLHMGYKAEINYGLSKNWYLKSDVRTFEHGDFGVGSRVGYQYKIYRFTPYAEVGFDTLPPQNQHMKFKFAYAGGLKYVEHAFCTLC